MFDYYINVKCINSIIENSHVHLHVEMCLFSCIFHDQVACLHVKRHMIVGVDFFSCMLCDDVACLHVERNS